MYAIPLLLENMPNNKARDDSKWTFTSRLFMVDTITGVPVSAKGSEEGMIRPKLVRYLSRLHIRSVAK